VEFSKFSSDGTMVIVGLDVTSASDANLIIIDSTTGTTKFAYSIQDYGASSKCVFYSDAVVFDGSSSYVYLGLRAPSGLNSNFKVISLDLSTSTGNKNWEFTISTSNGAAQTLVLGDTSDIYVGGYYLSSANQY
jgi:hypothetical protein